MGAGNLLQQLKKAGLVVRLRDDGALHVGPRINLNDELRATVRERRGELVAALEANAAQCCDHDNGAAEHAEFFVAWTDAEIELFRRRVARFAAIGRRDAEELAERLLQRDRDYDDRRLCLECTYLGDRGRCLAARLGRIAGASRDLEPLQAVLQRCPAFGLKKGLS